MSSLDDGSWSPLSTLNLVTNASPDLKPEDVAAELDLWTNVHFSFDIPPSFPLGEEKDPSDIALANHGNNLNPKKHNVLNVDTISEATTTTTTITETPSQTTSNTSINSTEVPVTSGLNSMSFLQSLGLPFNFDLSNVNAMTPIGTPNLITPTNTPSVSASLVSSNSTSDIITTTQSSSTHSNQQPALKKRRKNKETTLTNVPLRIPSPEPEEVAGAAIGTAASVPLPSMAEVQAQVREAHPELPDDEVERMAVEEDKRRRNTAASARFRVKKKLREQALEKAAQESAKRVELLVERVKELEKENKWLRGLIVDKSSTTDSKSV